MDLEAMKAELASIAIDCGGAIEQFMTLPPKPISVRIPVDQLEEFARRASDALARALGGPSSQEAQTVPVATFPHVDDMPSWPKGGRWTTPIVIKLMEEYAAAMASAPTPKGTWVHRKSGGQYQLIGSALIQSDTPLADMSPVVVYQGEDGAMWARAEDEFCERFTPTGAPIAEGGSNES